MRFTALFLGGLVAAGCHQAAPQVERATPSSLVSSLPTPAPATLKARLNGQEIALELPAGLSKPRLFRSTSPITPKLLTNPRAAISERKPGAKDTDFASGVTYHYAILASGKLYVAPPVEVPSEPLPAVKQPKFEVDKAAYILKVLDGERVVKRFPIVMGQMHDRRKLCYDNASTPEGRYTVYNLQPEATYHRAYDVDYPNAVDKARYKLLKPATDIGGEIQIHGRGIHSNWTFGCMALRDSDMDELFSHSEIAAGTPLWIYGGELSRADLVSDSLAPSYDPHKIGIRQRELGLPTSCLMDVETRKKIH